MSVVAESSIDLRVSPNEYICLAEVERFSDGSGFAANLSLRSGAFCLKDYRFFFDGLERFLTDLQQLYQSLSGSARLQTRFEEPYFELSDSLRGRVWVHGHIVCSADHRLDFGFMTDQTFLPPMISSVKAVLTETQQT